MPMLNYLGGSPDAAASMPMGMPGTGAPVDPMLTSGMAEQASQPPPMFGGPAPGGAPPPMGAPAPGGFPSAGVTDPSGQQYEAVTQGDGSILLHRKNPDGSRGPAVKIIPAMKPSKLPGQA